MRTRSVVFQRADVWLDNTRSMSDSNLLLGISAAYYIIANAKNKREEKRSKWIKNYFKTRNFGIINDLQ